MTRRNWKRVRARSLVHAMELCIEHARVRHNRSVDRVCDLMGEHSTSTLYKWLATGRLPAISIRPFEHACGATYVSEYLAASAHLLAVPMPSGRPAGESDVLDLQQGFPSSAAPVAEADLTDRQRLERDARSGVLAAVRRLQTGTGCSLKAALTTLLTSARGGRLDELLDRMLLIARDPRGRSGDGYPSVRTLQRWLGAADLAPRRRRAAMAVPAWAQTFLREYQQPQKPSVQAAYDAACRNWSGEPFSVHQTRRLLGTLGTVTRERGRMGPRELKNIPHMLDQACTQLAASGRLLIIDEFDYCVRSDSMVELVRDLHEGAGAAPILLIGEELLPNKLERWERFHSRVLSWIPAQPVSAADAAALAPIYCPDVHIGTDLLEHLVAISGGSVRRVSVNLANIADTAATEGWDAVSRATWGSRPLYTGEAPRRGV